MRSFPNFFPYQAGTQISILRERLSPSGEQKLSRYKKLQLRWNQKKNEMETLKNYFQLKFELKNKDTKPEYNEKSEFETDSESKSYDIKETDFCNETSSNWQWIQVHYCPKGKLFFQFQNSFDPQEYIVKMK